MTNNDTVDNLAKHIWGLLPTNTIQSEVFLATEIAASLHSDRLEEVVKLLGRDMAVARLSIALDYLCEDDRHVSSEYYWKPFVTRSTVHNYSYNGTVIETSTMIVVTIVPVKLLQEPNGNGAYRPRTEDVTDET